MRYRFELDGQILPDPYARWCPDGVHEPAAVWEPTYTFQHAPPLLKQNERIIYELHVGTFTPEGTYRAAQQKLGYLHDLGVTVVELMPLTAFPGRWGWGYDGVTLFAPFAGYGTPEELMAFIDEAHRLGIAVLLDLVLNHFGPDGNYLGAYSPVYFTQRHKTPWGDALDYAEPHMRRLVLDAALHWLRVYRFDGLRLDATHEIFDESTPHILAELVARAHTQEGGRPLLYCEDDRNDPFLVTQFGMDGLWADDFHHQVHVLLTGEQDGYYRAYRPDAAELARCIERGWLYEGQLWPLGDRSPRGTSADSLAASNLVYCLQNHDQIGNRATGDRLHVAAGTELFLAASMLLLFLPMTPLLFQGQEWLASAPFLYFSDHAGELGRQITAGRQQEFQHFEAFSVSQSAPDPQQESTFSSSVLDWTELHHGNHARAYQLYRRLLRLRRDDPVLKTGERAQVRAGARGPLLWVTRQNEAGIRVLLVNFTSQPVALDTLVGSDATLLLASSDHSIQSMLPPQMAVLLEVTAVPAALADAGVWADPKVWTGKS
ncbi:malto-oligosyltrehalose trehalohydrolase [Deinococcus ruber]|uniref:Malto-oligosyltrehalose trehalohydrolase n=1 Tax=Deinococcus ruber TaxID=1848197 RepID=A0A918FIY1_9DEIO|nr:malto-oligosyltrehalose trehalohydrolase [Deinococcus ruber]